MSLAGFTHIGDYTLPTLAGTHTNFPVLLRYADFHPDVIAALKSDASDLRFSLSDDTQIAHHVVRWNPAASDVLVHCCLPSASGSLEIKIWGDNPSATMLPETDTYGQYEAYKWFAWYAHDGRTNVANAGTLTYTGSEPDGVSPFSGISTGYDGVDDFSGQGVGYDLDIQQTFVAMAKVDAFPVSGYGSIVSIVQSTDNNRHAMLAVDSSGKARANKDRYTSDGAQGATTLSTGSWYHLGATFGAWGTVSHKVYLNGALDGTSNQDNQARYVNVNLFRIGSRGGIDYFEGEVAHAGMRQYREESADWMADHGSNLTAVGAWGTMTSEVVSSGDTNTANVSLSFTVPVFSGAGENTVPVNTADAAFTIGQPTFAITGGAPLPINTSGVSFAIAAPSFAVTAQNTLPEYTATILFNIGSVSFSGTGSTTVPINTGTVGLAVGEPAFAATGENLVPVNTGTASFSIGEPQFSITGDLNNGDNNADVSFSLAEPGFSGTGQNTVPEYTGDVVFGIGAPTFSATGTAKLEGNYGDISFSISEPVFSGTGENTVPVYSGSVSVTIQAPVFSATGTAVTPTNTGTIALTIPSVTFNGTGESTVPINQGTVQFSVPFLSFNLTGLTYDQSQLQFDTNTIRGTLPETILLTGSPNDPFSISSQIPSTLTIRGI